MGMDRLQHVTLGSLAAGATGERWEHTLIDIIKNIRDPNTEPTAKRKIVLTLTIQPHEDRESMAAKIDVTTNMASIKGYSFPMWVEKDDEGQYRLTIMAPQQEIEEQLEVAGTITPGKAGNE